MANLTIVYWRDIPAQVIVKAGRKAAKRQLSERFQEAIDRAAMRDKSHGTDAYLEAWRRGEPAECGADLDAEAESAANRIETAYDEAAIERLVRNGGRSDGLSA